jgi:predicted RNA polymerase sigma factor
MRASVLDRALALHSPGPYQLQAAIAALHDQASRKFDHPSGVEEP